MNSTQIPAQIQQAYELAYPNASKIHSFEEQIDRFNEQELLGFISGVKGKLFEIQYVDYLNNRQLPTEYVAELAKNPINAGWDISIIGPSGAVLDLIQAKATDSVAYVTEALIKNPHIDVVTTSEVHSQLIMQGFSENVIDSGILDSDLTSVIEGAANDAVLTMDWLPSSISFALIAFTTYNKEGLSAYEQSRQFGERSLKSYLSYVAGGSFAVATNTWWIGVIGAMGSRLVLESGRKKRDKLSQIKQLIHKNKIVLNRFEKQMS